MGHEIISKENFKTCAEEAEKYLKLYQSKVKRYGNWKRFENKDCIITYCLFKKIEGLVLAVDWHNSFSVIIRTNEGRVLLVNHITKIEIKGVDEVGK